MNVITSYSIHYTKLYEVSIELSYHVLKMTREALGDAYKASAADEVITRFIEVFDRKGKKSGKGFYDYPEGGKKSYNFV